MAAREDWKSTVLRDGREKELHDYIFAQPRETLENNPNAIVDAIDTFATIKTHMMTFKKHKLDASREILDKVDPKPKILVELGCYVGNSAVAWGAMLKDINGGSAEGVKVYSMELDKDFARIATDFVRLGGLQDTVEIVQGQSSDSLKRFKADGTLDKIDVLFIDHWEQFYLPDLRLCEELGLLGKGTVVIADNTDMPGAPDYLKYLRAGGSDRVKYETKTVSTTDPLKSNAPKLLEVSYVVEVN